MDCRVVVEAAVPVYDVETPTEAVRIAVSKTGASLNPLRGDRGRHPDVPER